MRYCLEKMLLIFSEPKTLPCKVLKTYSLKENVHHIIEENLPPHGHIFNGNGEYRDTCGSYLFEGRDTSSVKIAIQTAIQKFFIETISIL